MSPILINELLLIGYLHNVLPYNNWLAS